MDGSHHPAGLQPAAWTGGGDAWVIGGRLFDPVPGLLASPAGPVWLRPKSAAVLRLLAERAGRLVTREELLDAVWADRCVVDDSLTQCVTELRRALAPDLATALRTVPRRGYLLATTVERPMPASPLPPRLDVLEARIAELERRLAALARAAAGRPGLTPADAAPPPAPHASPAPPGASPSSSASASRSPP